MTHPHELASITGLKEARNFINGEFVGSRTGKTFNNVSPVDGRLIGIAHEAGKDEEVRITMERVERAEEPRSAPVAEAPVAPAVATQANGYDRLTTAKLAAKLGMPTRELVERLMATGLLELKGERHYLTPRGKEAGGEWRA